MDMSLGRTVAVAGDEVRIQWSSPGVQAGNVLIFMITLCVNASIVTIWGPTMWMVARNPSWTGKWMCKLALCLTYLTSFIFVFTNGLFQFGIGLTSPHMCAAAITLCVSAYASTKVCVNAFLLERVFIVSCKSAHMKSKAWLGGAAIYIVGIPILVLFIINRNSEILPSGMCHIGLAMQSMSLVAWDAAISIYLAAAFIWPLLHTIKSSRLKRLAIKSLIASIVSCITSVTNITVLIQMDGELGWLCLSLCTIDVLVNILCLAALTSPTEENQNMSTARGLNSKTSKGTREASRFQTSSSFGHTQSHIVSGIHIETATIQTYDDGHRKEDSLDEEEKGVRKPTITIETPAMRPSLYNTSTNSYRFDEPISQPNSALPSPIEESDPTPPKPAASPTRSSEEQRRPSVVHW